MVAQQRSAPVGAASTARPRSPSLSPPQRTSRPRAPKPLVRVSLDERERTLRSHFPQKQNAERGPGTQRRRLAQGLPVMPLSEVHPYEHMYTRMHVCGYVRARRCIYTSICVCVCARARAPLSEVCTPEVCPYIFIHTYVLLQSEVRVHLSIYIPTYAFCRSLRSARLRSVRPSLRPARLMASRSHRCLRTPPRYTRMYRFHSCRMNAKFRAMSVNLCTLGFHFCPSACCLI